MKDKHMSITGIGPIYVIIISILTVAALITPVRRKTAFAEVGSLRRIMIVVGILFVAEGLLLWFSVVLKSSLSKNIKENRLITNGAYSFVRNPIYSSFMILEWGLLLIFGSKLIIAAVPVYWIFMTLLLKNTEEKWLLELFGDNYRLYCFRVNRCIPWIRKH